MESHQIQVNVCCRGNYLTPLGERPKDFEEKPLNALHIDKTLFWKKANDAL